MLQKPAGLLSKFYTYKVVFVLRSFGMVACSLGQIEGLRNTSSFGS
jgi:hypothetical protein